MLQVQYTIKRRRMHSYLGYLSPKQFLGSYLSKIAA